MHLYFGDLIENDLLYDANGKKRKFVTKRQQNFKTYVLKTLENKPQEGYRWIPVFEPAKDSKGNLQYVAEKEVLRTLNSYQWENMFKEYSPENGSLTSMVLDFSSLQSSTVVHCYKLQKREALKLGSLFNIFNEK